MISSETDEISAVLVLGPAEMTDIVLTTSRHLGRPGVPDVRIVLPDDHPALGTVEGQERLEGVEHVLVAQVPGGGSAVVERAIVALRVGHETGVLCGIEESLAVPQAVLEPPGQQLAQDGHHLRLA